MSEIYKVVSESDVYTFLTDFGTKYYTRFIEDLLYLQPYPNIKNSIVEFSFGQFGDPVRVPFIMPHDVKVSRTIIRIVERFFEQSPFGILFFVCDSSDEAHRSRKILFGRWFHQFGASRFNKLDGEIEGNPTYYFSLIFKKEHPYMLDIQEAFSVELPIYQSCKL